MSKIFTPRDMARLNMITRAAEQGNLLMIPCYNLRTGEEVSVIGERQADNYLEPLAQILPPGADSYITNRLAAGPLPPKPPDDMDIYGRIESVLAEKYASVEALKAAVARELQAAREDADMENFDLRVRIHELENGSTVPRNCTRHVVKRSA